MHKTLARPARRPDNPEALAQEKARNFTIINLELTEGNLDLVTTTWIGGKIQNRKPVAFAMLWNFERHGNEDHPVLALLLADLYRCIMLRTNRTGHWLPHIVQELLQDEMVLKICASWTKRHKEKLAYCFSLELKNFTVLSSLAEARGISGLSLDALTDYMQLSRRRLLPQEGIDLSSDWEAKELTTDQRRHVQEFPHLLFQIWENLIKLPKLEHDTTAGILGIKDGWEEQGIRRRHDGLYCKLCNAGPILSTEQMEGHVQGRKHQRKAKPPEPVEAKLALSAELQEEGIEVSDFCSSESFGLYFCKACGVGPFHDLASVEVHVNGRKHREVCKKPKPNREAPKACSKRGQVEFTAADILRRHYGLPAKRVQSRLSGEPSAAELLRTGFQKAFHHFTQAKCRVQERVQEIRD